MSDGFRDRLLRGDRLIGTLLSLPSPELAEIASGAGFDWLFLDQEHGSPETGDLLRMAQAARPPCAPLVRVPENAEMWIKKALDAGAAGVIVPRVNGPDEAARAVHWAKYPPEGGRSVGFSRSNRYGAAFQESVETDNQATSLIVQIEHIDGVQAIEGILDVGGVDAVFIGPYDLSASLGKPGRIQDPDVREAINRVARSCARRSKPIGIFCLDIEGAARALAEGYSLLCVGIDIGLYSRAAIEIIGSLKPRTP